VEASLQAGLLASLQAGLLARWYCDVYSDEDGLWGQYLVASGSCPGKLYSIEGTTLATLVTRSCDQAASRKAKVNGSSKALIKQTQKAHHKIGTEPDHEMSEIDVFMGGEPPAPAPLLLYALSAYDMEETNTSTRFFQHLLDLALQFAHPTQQDDSSILADMIAFPSHGWLYRCEKGDYWSSLWSYPDPHLVAFDCEDGAKALLELFLVFQRCSRVPAGTRLHHFQQLARQYQPWLAIGELKSSDGAAALTGAHLGQHTKGSEYLLHCFLVLEPLGGAPFISIESTAYASGAWTKPSAQGLAYDRKEFGRAEAFASAQGVSAIARVRSPISMVRDQRMYGQLLALFGVDKNGRAQHHLFKDVETNDYLAGHKVSSRLLAIDEPAEQLRQSLAYPLSQQPPSVFPSPPPTSAASWCKNGSALLLPRPHQKSLALPVTRDMVIGCMPVV
jgi:hypothetical protein